jgi:hypothetical protein
MHKFLAKALLLPNGGSTGPFIMHKPARSMEI